MPSEAPAEAGLRFLAGGGATGAHIRALNWAETPLGPPETWPQSLRTTVSTCLNCSFPIAIWWGPELVLIYNDGYGEIIARKHPWALGRPGREVWPEIWDTIGPMLGRVLQHGEAVPAEDMQLFLERRGFIEECYFSFSYSPIRNEAGDTAGVFCPVVETTTRVFAERRARFLLSLEAALRDVADAAGAKRAASRLLAAHLGTAQAGYAEILPDGEHMLVEDDWNDGRMASNAGLHRLADMGPAILDDLRAGRIAAIEDVLTEPRLAAPGLRKSYAARHTRACLLVPLMRAGALSSVLFVNHTIRRPWSAQDLIYAQDIAERTASAVARASAEAALRRSEHEFRTLANNLPNLCWIADPQGSIYWFNGRCVEFTGRTQQELAAGAWLDLHDPEQREAVLAHWAQSVITGQPFEMIFPLRGAAGAYRLFLTRVVPLRAPDGAITKWFGTNVDITDQRQIEQRLRDSERDLRLLNETLEQKVAERTADRDRMWRLSTDIMLVARFDGTITAANPAWTSQLGWPEGALLGASFLDLVHPEDKPATIGAVAGLSAGETVLNFENRYRTKDGAYRWLSWTAVPDEAFIHAVGRDVTAEREAAQQLDAAQERLRQAQRMEALGQLAGGIAHDFNNVLQAVSGGLSVIRRRAADPEAVRHFAGLTETAASRGASVTSRLLAFARKSELSAIPVPVQSLLEGLREILAHTLDKSVAIQIAAPPGTPALLADRAQLETVLVNLAVNARDAMQEGGALTIAAAAEHIAPPAASAAASPSPAPPSLAPGAYVRLSVADTGAGMDAATLQRASEPFFTTKPPGQGTGLGLAMARGFAQQSGGALAIASTPGQGTVVTLWFPQVPAAAPAAAAAAAPPAEEAAQAAAQKLILLVDDEPVVRGVLTAHLEDLGYRLIAAADGLDALARLDAGAAPDLLISDYAMPGMNGLSLAREARRRLPHLPVLLLTGYVDPALQAGLDDLPGTPAVLLRKPVAAASLLSHARALLTP